MSLEDIPHTADVKFRVRADTPNALFSEIFGALMQVIYGKDRRGDLVKEVHIESSDIESLLADFLSEVLFISEVEGLVFSHAEITIKGLKLTAALHGELFDRARHSEGTEVKGISYSDLSISRDTNGYMLDIIFDV